MKDHERYLALADSYNRVADAVDTIIELTEDAPEGTMENLLQLAATSRGLAHYLLSAASEAKEEDL